MQLEGAVKIIGETKTYGSNGFRKRELVLITDQETQYPQPILIEFVQDKVDLLNNIAEGEQIKVSINIRGREYVTPQGETKYFNSITGWRIESIATAPPPQPKQEFPNEPETPPDDFQTTDDLQEEDEDPDFPF